MRKNYIDHLRITCILLLFPFHTCRIFTEENFYVHVKEVTGCELFVQLMNPWFMPILFLLAGMSTYLALNKRSTKQYLKERAEKLLVPCVFGVLLTIPIQTYYAEKYHNGYTGSYLKQVGMFFTKQTDLTGYTGGFTPAHLWFLFVLFVISIMAFPIILKLRKMKRESFRLLENPICLLLMLIPILLLCLINVAGIPIGKYFGLFIIGAIFCVDEGILDTIKKYRALFLGGMLIVMVQHLLSFFSVIPRLEGIYFGISNEIRMWFVILTVLGYSMTYWNGNSLATNYLRAACFPIYEVHQTLLVIVSYYVVTKTESFPVQYLGSMVLAFVLSIVVYEILRCFKLTRWLFAIKERQNLSKWGRKKEDGERSSSKAI